MTDQPAATKTVDVIYGGASARGDDSLEYVIRDANGKAHSLRKNVPAALPADLAKELLDGSDRTVGHKFTSAPKSA